MRGLLHSFATTSELLHLPDQLGEAHQIVEVVMAMATVTARAGPSGNAPVSALRCIGLKVAHMCADCTERAVIFDAL